MILLPETPPHNSSHDESYDPADCVVPTDAASCAPPSHLFGGRAELASVAPNAQHFASGRPVSEEHSTLVNSCPESQDDDDGYSFEAAQKKARPARPPGKGDQRGSKETQAADKAKAKLDNIARRGEKAAADARAKECTRLDNEARKMLSGKVDR